MKDLIPRLPKQVSEGIDAKVGRKEEELLATSMCPRLVPLEVPSNYESWLSLESEDSIPEVVMQEHSWNPEGERLGLA